MLFFLRFDSGARSQTRPFIKSKLLTKQNLTNQQHTQNAHLAASPRQWSPPPPCPPARLSDAGTGPSGAPGSRARAPVAAVARGHRHSEFHRLRCYPETPLDYYSRNLDPPRGRRTRSSKTWMEPRARGGGGVGGILMMTYVYTIRTVVLLVIDYLTLHPYNAETSRYAGLGEGGGPLLSLAVIPLAKRPRWRDHTPRRLCHPVIIKKPEGGGFIYIWRLLVRRGLCL